MLNDRINNYLIDKPPSSQAAVNRLLKFSKAHDIHLERMALADWQELFLQYRTTLVSLRRYRTALIDLYQWLIDQRHIDETMGNEALEALRSLVISHTNEEHTIFNDEGYYGSYDELMDSAVKDSNDCLSAPVLYAMLTLVWFGVDWRTALGIKKSDFLFGDDSVEIKGVTTIQNQRARDYLADYWYCTELVSASGRRYALKESAWYFRSRTSEHIDETALCNVIKSFNKAAKGFYSFDRIHDSSVYVKAHAVITGLGLSVTPSPAQALRPYLPKLLEMSAFTTGARSYFVLEWQTFYAWCKKHRAA